MDEIVCRRLAKGGHLAKIDHEADLVSEVGVRKTVRVRCVVVLRQVAGGRRWGLLACTDHQAESESESCKFAHPALC